MNTLQYSFIRDSMYYYNILRPLNKNPKIYADDIIQKNMVIQVQGDWKIKAEYQRLLIEYKKLKQKLNKIDENKEKDDNSLID